MAKPNSNCSCILVKRYILHSHKIVDGRLLSIDWTHSAKALTWNVRPIGWISYFILNTIKMPYRRKEK